MLEPNQRTVPLHLHMPIDGFDAVYWNGRLLKQIDIAAFPGRGYIRRYGPYLIPPEHLENTNVLAIRLYQPVAPAVFPAELLAGSVSLNGAWQGKPEKAFTPIDPVRKAAAPLPPALAPEPQRISGYLYNGMIHPLLPYAISGVIWYQGESNADRAFHYRTAFPLLIADWRAKWAQGDFPFYFCQLANYTPKRDVPGDNAWAELRESQSLALQLPNTGQAVLIDAGESADIHPRNKRDVGERLAVIALARDYGRTIPYSGPVYESVSMHGGEAVLSFRHADGGLAAGDLPGTFLVRSQTNETAPLPRNSPQSQLEGFAICGEDRRWVWANARIEGDKVVVSSPEVPNPMAVRYAWAANPTCNLYNGAGLPASPFRTDDLLLSTQDKK